MRTNFVSIIRNFSYAITSNVVSMFIALLVTLVVPKIIGVEDFGYWQLYLFYSSYVGFFLFGWNDGIYLRYGGEKYENLNKATYFSQFWLAFFLQIFIAAIINIGINWYTSNANEAYIIKMISVHLILFNIKFFLVYILQATNRIKEYSKIIIMDRVVYLIFILLFLFLGVNTFNLLIIAELLAQFFSLVYTVLICRDIVFRSRQDFHLDIKEIIENIDTGIKLMFANIASSLVIGVVRFGVEKNWGITTFGKISLTLSVSSLMMKFITALSLVIYPVLRRTKKENLSKIYTSIRTVLMLILLGSLLLYYPLKAFLTIWLPEYAESLKYMALVFPMIIYEGKVALLTNTYLKVLRKEKLILKSNIITVCVSIGITIITSYLLNNLFLAMVSIVGLLAFKSILAEKYLSGIMGINVVKDIALEAIMTICFILIAGNYSSWVGFLLYMSLYLIYLLIKRNEIKETYVQIKNLMYK